MSMLRWPRVERDRPRSKTSQHCLKRHSKVEGEIKKEDAETENAQRRKGAWRPRRFTRPTSNSDMLFPTTHLIAVG